MSEAMRDHIKGMGDGVFGMREYHSSMQLEMKFMIHLPWIY